MIYSSYETAQRKGRFDVWPGCGTLGRCMPCGRLHDFCVMSWDHSVRSCYQCWTNRQMGCPSPKPAAVHDFGKSGRCRRCGAVDQWVASDGKCYDSLRMARAAGWPRGALRRASEMGDRT